MEVLFLRTGQRRYAVEVHCAGAPPMRMDPSPGFDECFPHDMQHFIAEEQLGLRFGVFGQVEQGGTASTFHPVADSGSARTAARHRRDVATRGRALQEKGADDMVRSECATLVIWHDWMAHRPEPELQARATQFSIAVASRLRSMSARDRDELVRALPRIRARANELTALWSSVPLGASMSVEWTPSRRT